MRNSRNRYRNNSQKNQKLLIIICILLILILIAIISKSSSNDQKEESKTNISDTQSELNETTENETNSNTLLSNDISNESSITEENPEPQQQPETGDVTFTMAVTGDIMSHNTVFKDAYNSSSKKYDFSHMFKDVKYHLQTADITVGNLETTFAGSKVGYSGYPTFNTPESLAKTLKDVGFDVLSTANNHSLDKGYNGIVSTINYLDKADISHTGTYKSKEDSEKIIIKNVKGVSIAFLSFTYGTNGISIPKGKEYCINLNDKETMLKQLSLAKEQEPDIICVCMHWGTEYQTSPNSTQKDLAKFLLKNGADIILGNHPHVLQSMERKSVKLDDGSSKNGFVIYSLGNFLADQGYKYTRNSAIVNLKITKKAETGEITVDSATYAPTYIYRNDSTSKNKFKIIDIDKEIEKYESGDTSIGKNLYNTLKTELKNIKKLLGNEIK